MAPHRLRAGDVRVFPAFHLMDVLTGDRDGGDHGLMPATSERLNVRWSGRASKRSIGEGVAALLLRRGRLGSPPA